MAIANVYCDYITVFLAILSLEQSCNAISLLILRLCIAFVQTHPHFTQICFRPMSSGEFSKVML